MSFLMENLYTYLLYASWILFYTDKMTFSIIILLVSVSDYLIDLEHVNSHLYRSLEPFIKIHN